MAPAIAVRIALAARKLYFTPHDRHFKPLALRRMASSWWPHFIISFPCRALPTSGEPLQTLCDENGVKGTLLLAHEGINGTIAGPDAGIHAVLAFLRAQPEFSGLEHKESRASSMPFLRMKVKLKKEIVTMGVEDIDPNKVVGTYVAPKDWNALISDPETHRHRHPQRLRDGDRHLQAARSTRRPRPSANFPTGCASNRRPAQQAEDRHVLHRRHPLREGHRLHEG